MADGASNSARAREAIHPIASFTTPQSMQYPAFPSSSTHPFTDSSGHQSTCPPDQETVELIFLLSWVGARS
jgi:hypothetical protein